MVRAALLLAIAGTAGYLVGFRRARKRQSTMDKLTASAEKAISRFRHRNDRKVPVIRKFPALQLRNGSSRMAIPRAGAGMLVVGGAAGAAAIYMLNPHRREVAAERLGGALRLGSRGVRKLGRYATSGASSLKEHTPVLRDIHFAPLTDAELAERVRNAIFHEGDPLNGQLAVSAEGGVVILRGEVDTPEQMAELEKATRSVPGVRDVDSLLHLPGMPVPGRTTGNRSDAKIS